MCVSCREMKPKSDLMRIVCTKEGEIFFDGTSKVNGRGAYLCRNEECIKKAQKTSALSRTLGTAVDDSVFEKLTAEVRKS